MKMESLRAAVLKIGVLATLQPSDTAVILSRLSLRGVCQEDQPNMPCRKAKVGGPQNTKQIHFMISCHHSPSKMRR